MDYLELLVQTVLAFTALLVFARLLGKQQVGQLTFFEYVAGITIGSIGGTLATDVAGRTEQHFFSLIIFCSLTFMAQYLGLVSRPARKILDGEPTIVIHNGKILEDNLKKMRYNLDEMMQELRLKDVFSISQVEFGVLEPNGKLSVQLKSSYMPVTPHDLHLSTPYKGVESELIMDGKIIQQNLKQNNLDQQWLTDQLRQRGITELDQVVLASLATDGTLYVDQRKDQLAHATDITDTYAQGKDKE